MDFEPKQLFTTEQANRTLPLVRRIVADVQRVYARLVLHAEMAQRAEKGTQKGLDDAHSTELDSLHKQIEDEKAELLAYVKELDELGVLLKGPGDGLVDFPCLREGRVVFLCWKLGEDEIRFWHDIDAGFPGRQPLDEALAVVPSGAQWGQAN